MSQNTHVHTYNNNNMIQGLTEFQIFCTVRNHIMYIVYTNVNYSVNLRKSLNGIYL